MLTCSLENYTSEFHGRILRKQAVHRQYILLLLRRLDASGPFSPRPAEGRFSGSTG
jgi:hypothetical protein